MSNIRINKEKNNVQSHINEIHEFLDNFLPSQYLEAVREILERKGINHSDSLIGKVKRKAKDNIEILDALVEVALESKKRVEKLSKKIKK